MPKARKDRKERDVSDELQEYFDREEMKVQSVAGLAKERDRAEAVRQYELMKEGKPPADDPTRLPNADVIARLTSLPHDALLTVPEVMKLARVSKSTVYKAMHNKVLEYKQVPTKPGQERMARRVSKAALMKWLGLGKEVKR